MIRFLGDIRTPDRSTPFLPAALHTLFIALAGLVLGVGVKLLDLYTVYLGDIFSQMSIWIFLCTLISTHSSTPKRAAINVLTFCLGMLPTYYVTAEITSSAYSLTFVYGWVIFSLCSPVLAFIVWYAKGRGNVSKLLTAGVILAILVIAAVMFDRIRISDLIISAATGFLLWKKPKKSVANS